MTKPKFEFPDIDFSYAKDFDSEDLKTILLDAAEDMAMRGLLTTEEYKACVKYVDLWVLHIKETKQ